MKFMLHHLTGSQRGQTQYFDVDSLRFGTGHDCGVRFQSNGDGPVMPVHAELVLAGQAPMLRDLSGQHALFLNNRKTVQAALHDGDLIQLGEHGPLIRFRILPNQADGHKPWRYIVEDSRDMVGHTPHKAYASLFYLIRHVAGDILRYGTLATKMTAALLILAPLVLIGVLSVSLYFEYQQAKDFRQIASDLETQVETGKLGREELESRIARERDAKEKLQEEQKELKADLQAALKQQQAARDSQEEVLTLQKQLALLESEQRFSEGVIQRFHGGIGLLHGGYKIYESETGRPLRYQGYHDNGAPYRDEDGMPLMTLESENPVVVIFFSGTGVLVDEQGTVLTNRHLVRMWEAYAPVAALLDAGFEPKMEFLRIFFPDSDGSYELEEVLLEKENDFAVLRTTNPPKGHPHLQLAPADQSIQIGEPVIIMSYPGTIDSILSRLPQTISERIVRQVGGDHLTLPDRLAEEGLIRPLTTHGYVADVSSDVVTFEARSSQGSSGGAVLNREGLLIAINHSTLRAVGGINLGISIRKIREHLNEVSLASAE